MPVRPRPQRHVRNYVPAAVLESGLPLLFRERAGSLCFRSIVAGCGVAVALRWLVLSSTAQVATVPVGMDQAATDQAVTVPVGMDQAVTVPVGMDQAATDQAVTVPVGMDQAVTVPVGMDQAVTVPVGMDQAATVPVGMDQAAMVPVGMDQAATDQAVTVPVGMDQAVTVPVGMDQAATVQAATVPVPPLLPPVQVRPLRLRPAVPILNLLSLAWDFQVFRRVMLPTRLAPILRET